MTQPFADRREAGRMLARQLGAYAGGGALVLALPRGGVPVASEVAYALSADLDVFLVRKLGVPGHEELAMGAIASGGVEVVNRDVVQQLGITQSEIDWVAEREQRELARRERAYRGDRPMPEIKGRVVILVDDGLATGSTMRAAVTAVRHMHPAKIIVAVPVAPPDSVAELSAIADEVVAVARPEPFYGVGAWYRDFSQTSDEEVTTLLAERQAV